MLIQPDMDHSLIIITIIDIIVIAVLSMKCNNHINEQ
jgi:hypothetical protein